MDQDVKPSKSFRNAHLALNSTSDREHQTARDTTTGSPEPMGGSGGWSLPERVTPDLWFPNPVVPVRKSGRFRFGGRAERITFDLVGLRQGQMPGVRSGAYRMVVDDDPLVLEVTADMLKDLVAKWYGGERHGRARAPFGKRNIDILVTDLNMPTASDHALWGREIDGRGWPVVRKPFLEQDLAHTRKETTGVLEAEPRAFGAELHDIPPRRGRSDGRMSLENLVLSRASIDLGTGSTGAFVI